MSRKNPLQKEVDRLTEELVSASTLADEQQAKIEMLEGRLKMLGATVVAQAQYVAVLEGLLA
jgi:hypothetical protein